MLIHDLIIYRHIFIHSYVWHATNWRQVLCARHRMCSMYMYVFIHVTCERQIGGKLHILIHILDIYMHIFICSYVWHPTNCRQVLCTRHRMCSMYMYVFIHVTCDRQIGGEYYIYPFIFVTFVCVHFYVHTCDIRQIGGKCHVLAFLRVAYICMYSYTWHATDSRRVLHIPIHNCDIYIFICSYL